VGGEKHAASRDLLKKKGSEGALRMNRRTKRIMKQEMRGGKEEQGKEKAGFVQKLGESKVLCLWGGWGVGGGGFFGFWFWLVLKNPTSQGVVV